MSREKDGLERFLMRVYVINVVLRLVGVALVLCGLFFIGEHL